MPSLHLTPSLKFSLHALYVFTLVHFSQGLYDNSNGILQFFHVLRL